MTEVDLLEVWKPSHFEKAGWGLKWPELSFPPTSSLVHVHPAATYLCVLSFSLCPMMRNPVLGPVLLLEIQLGFLYLSLSSSDR